MGRQLDYYLTMASPWAYLGHAALMAAMARNGIQVAVRPTPLGRLFPQTGGLPLPQRHPARQHYRLIDLQRWRNRRGVPLKLKPAHSRFDPSFVDRHVIAGLAAGAEVDDFMRAAFQGVWVHEFNLGDRVTVERLAREHGFAESVLALAEKPEILERYDRNLSDAIAAGVFGAPSYVLDGEVFWGQDRIELLVEAIESGRAPFRMEE
ncbi:2-hydroxychromene-2-carboxylate isomerase [Enterovirga sp. CN4-39]|uniref:2-hydroxychromene-2-carboxylate isomerase n=1 Tax=Enterovirga sp. CN4-39 TaxID=3400910 RepID=UPI003C0FC1E8